MQSDGWFQRRRPFVSLLHFRQNNISEQTGKIKEQRNRIKTSSDSRETTNTTETPLHFFFSSQTRNCHPISHHLQKHELLPPHDSAHWPVSMQLRDVLISPVSGETWCECVGWSPLTAAAGTSREGGEGSDCPERSDPDGTEQRGRRCLATLSGRINIPTWQPGRGGSLKGNLNGFT